MTYKDIKLASLQKMFNDVTETEATMVTKPYLDKMAYVCNCAIERITAAGFGERKYAEIISAVPENMLGSSASLYKVKRAEGSEKFEAPKGKSWFFELFGKGTVKIYLGGKLIKTVVNTDESIFTKYKGIISNEEDKPVVLEFDGDSAFLRKNVAVYNDSYASEEDVYEISEMKIFDMSEITADFFKFDSENSVICDGDNTAYGFMGEKIFCVNGLKSGVWKVPYIAYPQLVTAETPDNQVINLPENLCGIIPYYIASELYLEDDSGLCVGWRNKFEAELREFVINGRRVPQNRYKIVALGGDRNGVV